MAAREREGSGTNPGLAYGKSTQKKPQKFENTL